MSSAGEHVNRKKKEKEIPSQDGISITSESKPRPRNNYTPEFESFWSVYPKGHGTKSLAFAEWKRLSAEQQAEAAASIPAFKAGRRWQEGYIVDCERFLKRLAFESPPDPWTPTAPQPAQTYAVRNGQVAWTSERLAEYARELEQQGR